MKTRIYINAASAISIQDTFLCPLLPLFKDYGKECCFIADPDFSPYVSPIQARRLSRIVKRAVAVAKTALKEANLELPDAIISGTGLGCIEDTEKFLLSMINQGEQCLQPSAFMHSTHNTLGSQIAIQLGCHGWNNTHVQRNVSFESALMEAAMLLESLAAQNVVVGGYDEMSPSYFLLLKKAGYFPNDSQTHRGAFAGEGSTAFVLGREKTENTYACIEALSLDYSSSPRCDFGFMLKEFLKDNSVDMANVGAIYTGADAEEWDGVEVPKIVAYRDVCGTYFTAGAFGMFLAAKAVKESIPKDSYAVVHGHSDYKQQFFMLLKNE